MKIVYLIACGSYSDYTVLGVYSTKEKAEEIIQYLNGCYVYSDLCIEEKPFDLTPQEGKRVIVYLRISDGEVLRTENFNLIAEMSLSKKGLITQLFNPPPLNEWVDTIYYFADTLERAIKAGNEKRAQYLASGLTREDWNKTL